MSRRPALPIAHLVALLLIATAAAADWPLTIIDLQHRLPDELVPLLEPLAGPDGVVTGANASLFVRAAPARLADIRAALARLDAPARNLLVEVRRASTRSAEGAAVGARIDVPVGDDGRVRIGSGPPGWPPGTSEITARAGSAATDRAMVQQVRVLDGGEALITVGSERPVTVRERYRGRDGVISRDAVDYIGAETGFLVRPRVNGARVVVDIESRDAQQLRGERFATGALTTQVSGRLGEWIPLGGTAEQMATHRQDILAAGRASGESLSGLELRVREID